MKPPSALGAAIETAIDRDARYRKYAEPIQYLCCYQTGRGHVFAFERVTKTQITLWLPEHPAVRSVAEKDGLKVEKSVPFPDARDPARYGRLSSLQSIPELRDAILFRIVVTSVASAMTVIGALA